MRPGNGPRRRLLRRATGWLGGAALALFVMVFLYGLFSPAGPPSTAVIDFGGLAAGEAQLSGWSGRPVWVHHRNAAQLEAMALSSAHVRGAEGTVEPRLRPQERSLLPQYGIFLAETRAPGIIVRYVAERPRGLPADVPWRGGFINPQSKEVFDLAGRPYRSASSPGAAPLAVPPHRYLARELVEMGGW